MHYDKHVGVVKITMAEADAFCRRCHPDKYELFKKTLKSEDYPVFVDFEHVFRGMEGLLPYRVLIDVIKTNTVSGAAQKAYLAHFVVWQHMRSHAIMNAMLELRYHMGMSKFDHLIEFKWCLSGGRLISPVILSLAMSDWRLYHPDRDTFPLSDSAVSLKPGSIMVALSPRHLLEIDWTSRGEGCGHRGRIDPDKLAEFRRRTIGNTFREIIFSDPEVLEEWRNDPAFQERVELIRKMKRYNALVDDDNEIERWKVNAFGNM